MTFLLRRADSVYILQRSFGLRRLVRPGLAGVRLLAVRGAPGHHRCKGFVMVFRHLDGEIAWGCDSCGDEGVIRGWEGSPTDV